MIRQPLNVFTRMLIVFLLVFAIGIITEGCGGSKSSNGSNAVATPTGSGSSAGTGSNSGTVDIARFELEVFDIVNQERASVGLYALLWDPAVAAVARRYSETMRDNNHFDHIGPDGSWPPDRLRDGGVSFSMTGENIAISYSSPSAVMTAWMNSPAHRANILNNEYTHMGVGLALSGYWWTQNFIR